jgi:hypothetical protein
MPCNLGLKTFNFLSDAPLLLLSMFEQRLHSCDPLSQSGNGSLINTMAQQIAKPEARDSDHQQSKDEYWIVHH